MPSWRFGGARLCHRCFCAGRIGGAHIAFNPRTFCASHRLPEREGRNHKPAVRKTAKLGKQNDESFSLGQGGEDLNDAKAIKERITRLEQELKALQKGFLSSAKTSFAQFTDAEKVELAKTLGDGTNSVSGDLSTDLGEANFQTSSFGVPEPSNSQHGSANHVPDRTGLHIQLPLFEEDDVSLAQLNACIRAAAKKPSDEEVRRELWRWYSRCKTSLSSLLQIIPDNAWGVIWASQQHVSPTNRDRAAHLRILAEDILASGRLLDPEQELSYIDSLFAGGDVDRALQEWNLNSEALGANGQIAHGFWALGVRMYAAKDLPEKAQETANSYLSRHEGSDSRILIQVIAAWALKRDDSGLRIAWSLYVRLKAQLGEDMSMEDYDKVSMSFMNAGRTDLALAVFKDMMLTGTPSGEDSTALYSRAMGVIGSLQSISTDQSELNNVSMSALTILPRKFQNKFFYGSWMKKLIGMGEVDAAAMVIELMYERGVKPDAKHLNGIIGAWLRDGGAEARKKAERMGWAMIQERLDFVQRRHTKDGRGEMPSKPSGQIREGPQIPSFLRRTVSPATVETFSILVLYYSRRAMYTTVEQLTELLAAAELSPTTYYINHLLYAELRKQDYVKAWELYARMNPSVKADLETFACLWDCEKQCVDTSKVPRAGHFPNPQRLFRAMMTWFSKASSQEQLVARQEFTKELYDQVIRCFCLSKDFEGTLVAMHAMSQSFGMHPDPDTARMIALHITRLRSPDSEVRRSRRSRLARSSNSKADVTKIAKVLEMLTERRLQALAERGLKFENLDEQQQADEQLYLMSELLRVVMHKVTGDASVAETNVEKAAWEMGVGGMSIKDPLDSAGQ